MGWFRRKSVATVAAMSPQVPVAAYALYVRGRRLSPGAAIYGYGGDVAATAMFPLSGSGQITPGGINFTRFQTMTPLRQVNINGRAKPSGQLAVIGLINDPTGVGSGYSLNSDGED